MTYRIVRYFNKIDGTHKRKILEKGVTLKEAQKHCRDPKTRKEGLWFDGYEQELCTKCGHEL